MWYDMAPSMARIARTHATIAILREPRSVIQIPNTVNRIDGMMIIRTVSLASLALGVVVYVSGLSVTHESDIRQFFVP